MNASLPKTGLDDLMALSAQISRQAFAQPPVEGWLNSFLALFSERFAGRGVQGVQVVQAVGNMGLQVGAAGVIPEEQAGQISIDPASPISEAIRTRQSAAMTNARVYPILSGNDCFAVLIVYLKPGAALEPELDTMTGVLATQLGPAMAQTMRKPGPQTGRLLRQVDMLRSVYEVTRDISAALDSSDLLNRTARTLVETLRIDHVGIAVIDYKTNATTVISEFPDNGIVGTRISLNSPLQERIIATRSPVIVNNVDTAEDLGTDKFMFQQVGIKSLAILPMVVQGELIGTVGLDVYYQYRDFTQEEVEAAATIASQLAISAHNAHLYEELKRRAHQFERLAELSRRITSTFDRNRIFLIAREETLKVIDAHMVVVALRSADGALLNMFILTDDVPIVADVPTERAALRFIFNATEPLVLDDISGSEEMDYRLLSGSQMRAAALAPLVAGARVIGAYCILHREPGHFGTIDLAVLEQVGNQLGIALENARLYTQTVQRAETERLMNRLSSVIQSRGDLKSMVLGTVQEMATALGARRARIRLEIPRRVGDETRPEKRG